MINGHRWTPSLQRVICKAIFYFRFRPQVVSRLDQSSRWVTAYIRTTPIFHAASHLYAELNPGVVLSSIMHELQCGLLILITTDSNPVFQLLDHLLSVEWRKSLRATVFFFFGLRGLESIGEFFFGPATDSICAWKLFWLCTQGKFYANEFCKHAYEIFKSRPYKRMFTRKWTIRSQFTQCQRTITRPKLPE